MAEKNIYLSRKRFVDSIYSDSLETICKILAFTTNNYVVLKYCISRS